MKLKLKQIFFYKSLRKTPSLSPTISRNAPSISSSSSLFSPPSISQPHPFSTLTTPIPFSSKALHSLQPILPTDPTQSQSESDDPYTSDGPMNDFLSRFTWLMRSNLSQAYPDCDKPTIDAMLLIIIDKVVKELEKGDIKHMLDQNADTPSHDFSQDLWTTVWEVSNMVLEDMRKEKKKERMKKFLQSENVKKMCRFASEVGVRGDMLREFRFKWAQEEMEMSDLYDKLNQIRDEDRLLESQENTKDENTGEGTDRANGDGEEKPQPKVVSIPQRRGKIKYKIYGLDLSDPKWGEVAERIHETEKLITLAEPKEITGKCKVVVEKILSLNVEDDPLPLLGKWQELLQPGRVDWIALLDKLKERNLKLYFKVAELALSEDSFQTNIRDYSKLIDAHAKDNHIDDAERILKKMSEKGIQPDILTSIILLHMYSKAGNLDLAKAAFESLRSQGFQPDMKAYMSMIMAYVNAGQTKLGESLLREMEARDMKPTKEIYMALLRSFSERGHIDGAQRIATTMQFTGFQPTLESCMLLVEAYVHAGDSDQAQNNFDLMIKLGHRPDDRCTASMMTVYEKNNYLDKALNLLLQLEKDGFEPGVATYTVLVDWLGKLQLVDEAEELFKKITEKGDIPPIKVHVSLCDMYSRTKDEKKALRALGILEGKKELLGADDFERIISGLIYGGLVKDAWRVHDIMEARGFTVSDPLRFSLSASQVMRPRPKRE